MMDGRVKTLHPKIHGGILARRGLDEAVMAEHNIDAIDLVVVNLYPFAATVAKPNCSLADAIENIDIGSPNYGACCCEKPCFCRYCGQCYDYDTVVAELKTNGALSYETRFDLAVKAFEHTAQYDGIIASYLGARVGKGREGQADKFARTFNTQLNKAQRLALW